MIFSSDLPQIFMYSCCQNVSLTINHKSLFNASPNKNWQQRLSRHSPIVSFHLLIIHQHLLDLTNSVTRVESFGAGLGAVHNGVALVHGVTVVQSIKTLLGVLIPGIDHPLVSLHEDGRSQVLVRVPPVGWAGSGAAGAQNALIQSVHFSAVCLRLDVLFAIGRRGIPLQVGLDVAVLFVEVGHIGHEIFDHIHVGQWVDLRGFVVIWDLGCASQSVGTLDVHSTRTADALSAAPTESESGILLVLDLEQSVQNHWSGLVQIDGVVLDSWFVPRLFGVPSVDAEGFQPLHCSWRCLK